MILGLQFFSYRMIQAGRERAVIQQMLRDGERQYAHSKELIDMVNRSVHDLKHTLRALRTMQESDRMAFVEETERNLEQYQQLVHTDNEILNTILAEKSLYCQSRGIRFACTLGKTELSFVSMPDLYTLLGNAIDNAVEGVTRLEEGEKRVVQLSIQTGGGCVSSRPITTMRAGFSWNTVCPAPPRRTRQPTVTGCAASAIWPKNMAAHECELPGAGVCSAGHLCPSPLPESCENALFCRAFFCARMPILPHSANCATCLALPVLPVL